MKNLELSDVATFPETHKHTVRISAEGARTKFHRLGRMQCGKSVILLIVVFLVADSAAQEAESKEDALMDACAMGNLAQVKALLAEGVSVNLESADGETPLHLSSIQGSMDVAQFLIEQGADVNKRAHGRHSLAMAPLHWFLFMKGCTEGVKALIDAGARVNEICWTEERDFLTPLDIALKLGENRLKEKEMLIAAGAKRYEDMSEEERSAHAPPADSAPPPL